MKKKTIVPLIVFLVGICLLSVFTYNTNVQIQKDRRTIAKLNAVTYGQRIENDIENGIEITDTLKQVLINGNGQIIDFSKIAENLMSYSIQSVQLAPNGVVTEIYPEEGNEAGKIDLLNDSKRGEISNYAKDHNTIITQGPVELKQGGSGLVVRNPIYLEDENGQEYFWGFTIAVLRVPEVFEDSTNALSKFKYNYRLSREASVLDKKYVEVDANCDKMIRPVTYNLTVGKEKWKLEIMSRAGWSNSTNLYLIFFGGLSLVLLLTGLTIVLFLLDERRVELKELANKDGLQSDVRKQLGFVLNDISENLPGAFIIYRADKEDDEIFYANKEFLDMAGYENLDAFFNGTKKSFRNLIREDQQKAVEASIWNQIESGSKNDYIHYQLRRQDGTYIPVLDQGRIVESKRFGRVF